MNQGRRMASNALGWLLNKSNNTRTYSHLVLSSCQCYAPASAVPEKFETNEPAKCNNGTF